MKNMGLLQIDHKNLGSLPERLNMVNIFYRLTTEIMALFQIDNKKHGSIPKRLLGDKV
jgi:hypothetical protein